MQVFVSYAHTPSDTALARYLAARLGDIGIKTWLDESALTAGRPLQADIEKAIAESSAGLFIVSQSWLAREWTAFELEQFSKRDPEIVRRIPILRLPRERMSLPPALVKIKAVPWLEDETDADARVWEIYCAITDTAPGPIDDWNTRGRSLSKSSTPISSPTTARPRPAVRPSLRCDRALQWNALDGIVQEPSNEIIFVGGSAGQAHEHFLERVQRLLRLDPPRSVIAVDWPTRPHSRDEFREALARAFTVPPDRLAEEIGARLVHANLILLHPCVRARFVDHQLVKYHTTWLPELLAECRARMNLKCVQLVEWPPDPAVPTRMVHWLRLRAFSEEDAHPFAERLIARIRTEAASTLRAIRLHDLSDVANTDLLAFCDLMDLKDRQRTWFLERISARGPKTTQEIFQAIDDYLPDARSLR